MNGAPRVATPLDSTCEGGEGEGVATGLGKGWPIVRSLPALGVARPGTARLGSHILADECARLPGLPAGYLCHVDVDEERPYKQKGMLGVALVALCGLCGPVLPPPSGVHCTTTNDTVTYRSKLNARTAPEVAE